MIDRTLPPLAWDATRLHELALEGFALSYLAYYNLASVGGRPADSFLRAFGYSNGVSSTQRAGGVPAYAVASTLRPAQFFRLCIGIEGTSDIGQVVRYGGAGATNPAGLTGYVRTYAYDCANTIKYAIESRGDWQMTTAPIQTQILISGHSLGAAVAEVLAALLKKAHPRLSLKLYKFASPRVGTAAWVNAPNAPADRMNYYLNRDPIKSIPASIENRVTQNFTDPWSPIFALMAPNDPTTFLNQLGQTIAEDRWNANAAVAYTFGVRGITDSNPWQDHDRERYRLMCSFLANQRIDHLYYRFIFLEFPDDNRWGIEWSIGTRNPPDLHELLDNPPDQPVALPPAEERVLEGSTGGGEDFEDWIGGEDGDEQPVVTRPIVTVNPGLRSRTRNAVAGRVQ